jgi:hypothetical protein
MPSGYLQISESPGGTKYRSPPRQRRDTAKSAEKPRQGLQSGLTHAKSPSIRAEESSSATLHLE